jgi:hypothetical protein
MHLGEIRQDWHWCNLCLELSREEMHSPEFLDRTRIKEDKMRRPGFALSILEEATFSLYDLNPRVQQSRWPFYAVLLFSTYEEDKDLAEFIQTTTIRNCLVGVPQNPKQWNENWHKRWKKRLKKRGIDYDDMMKQWEDADDSDTLSHQWAVDLGIDVNLIPCIVFMEQFPTDRTLNIPIPTKKQCFKDFFGDLFTAVQHVAQKYPIEEDSVSKYYVPGVRLEQLRKEWKYHGWLRWEAAPWLEPRLDAINKWGNKILEVPSKLVDLAPLLPLTRPSR